MVAQIGAAFLVAYGIETTWVVRETDRPSGPYQTWLGLVTAWRSAGSAESTYEWRRQLTTEFDDE